MAQASEELGSEAALVTSRPSPPEVRHLGEYEVVFATDAPEPVTAALPIPAAGVPTVSRVPAEAENSLQSVLAELRGLRQQIMRQTAMRAVDDPRWMASQPEVAEAYASLLNAEVDPDLALGLVLSAHERACGEPTFVFRDVLRDEIARMIPIDATIGHADCGMVALIGPPGVGKTAMLTRLAIHYGLLQRRPVHFISLDTVRVAASEQLRAYASILGASFEAVQSTGALDRALRVQRRNSLVFIDTPGFTARDLCDEGDDTALCFGRRDEIQKHLVLPSYLPAADLARLSAAYAAFRPSRLIFTHIDQTEIFGPLLCEAVRSKLPLSFFGTGQKVPEDMEEASAAALAARILPPKVAATGARSAA